MQIDAVRARAAAAEKLLSEARRLLAQRGEELRELDQKSTEADYAREKAEKRIAAAEASVAAQQTEFNELKTNRDRLIEKSGVVVTALKLRETQLQRAEDAAKAANERALRAEADARESGEAFQRRLEELTTVLDRERLDHQVTTGALESTRNEREQLRSRLLQLQMEANRLAVNEPPTTWNSRVAAPTLPDAPPGVSGPPQRLTIRETLVRRASRGTLPQRGAGGRTRTGTGVTPRDFKLVFGRGRGQEPASCAR